MLNSADADGVIARFIMGKEPEGNGTSKQARELVGLKRLSEFLRM